MRPVLPLRFESVQIFRDTATSSSFLATDHDLLRNNVVIKAIRKGSFAPDRETIIEHFGWHRGLRHPHLAPVLDAGVTPKGDLFYVRDFAPPTSMFATRDMDQLKVLLGVVEFMHSVGRVHGSIKPSNLLTSGKVVQLADAWVPKPWKGAQSEEEVRFSAPEVLKGHARTIESDLYSVGALLYRFFSGRDLFDDSDLESLAERHIWASPRPLTSVSYVSRIIADIVENLISKDPSVRRPAFESLKNEFQITPVAATRAPAVGIGEKLKEAGAFIQKDSNRLRALVVEAPLGFGKTRFVEELRHRIALENPGIVSAVCPAPKGRSPYMEIAQWLLSLHDRHAPSFEEPSVQRLMTYTAGKESLHAHYDLDRLLDDLVDVVALIARRVELVLYLEDFDRTSPKVKSFWASLASRSTRNQVRLVVLARPSLDAERNDVYERVSNADRQWITLKALDADLTRDMAQFLQLDAERCLSVQDKSGGNPAFVEAYCANSGDTIPQVVQDSIVEILSILPSSMREVLEQLALLDKPLAPVIRERLIKTKELNIGLHLPILKRFALTSEMLFVDCRDIRRLVQQKMHKGRRARLHRFWFEQLAQSNTASLQLARHAFHGGLMERAGALYRELAKTAFERGDLRSAAEFLERVKECNRENSGVSDLSPLEIIQLARSRAFLGDAAFARRELDRLLSSDTLKQDSSLLSAAYGARGWVLIEPSAKERLRLQQLSVACLPEDSPELVFRYRTLAESFTFLGDFASAEDALDKAERLSPRSDYFETIAPFRSSLLILRGRFKEAAQLLSPNHVSATIPGAVLNRLATCMEELGDLKEARRLFELALGEIAPQKTSAFEMYLGNLASAETKLGNMAKAEELFQAAARNQRERDQRNSAVTENFFYTEFALMRSQLGNLRSAIDFLAKVETTWVLNVFRFLTVKCAVLCDLGSFDKARHALGETEKLGLRDQYYIGERLLLERRFPKIDEDIHHRLEHAWREASRMGWRYQQCRLALARSESFIARENFIDAFLSASEARTSAEKHAFAQLRTQAALLLGQSAETITERYGWLEVCLTEASSVGLLPLVIECLFQLGKLKQATGNHSSASDYLFKGVSLTRQIADDLSASDRKLYLNRATYQEAVALLREQSARTGEVVAVSREPLGKQELLLGGIHRLTSSLTRVTDIPMIVSALIRCIGECLSLDGAIIIETSNQANTYPLKGSLAEEMKQRALTGFSLTKKTTYFTKISRTGGYAVCVPVPSRHFRTAIYVEQSSNPVDEQTIQFLAIAGAITGSSLDRGVDVGAVVQVSSSSLSNYGIVGTSGAIRRIYEEIQVAASNSSSVLIEGESGTGKELVAKAIHATSTRANGPFVPIDCGALPESLIESELFGACKGAYTGASEARTGLFESANGGTIFLDEIGNASAALQTSLLRVLQEREIRRIGEIKGRPINVRLIAATNVSLDRLVSQGRFRQDLLFRFKVLHIQLLPLRMRRDDIPLLAEEFLARLNTANNTKKVFSTDVIANLSAHDYPGNVRELQNVVERSFYTNQGTRITQLTFQTQDSQSLGRLDDTESWFTDLSEGRKTFWSAVRDRYRRRDVSRERVLALVDRGLRCTNGNYKALASLFKIEASDYRRFMDFLRRNDCLLDFRPYRRGES